MMDPRYDRGGADAMGNGSGATDRWSNRGGGIIPAPIGGALMVARGGIEPHYECRVLISVLR